MKKSTQIIFVGVFLVIAPGIAFSSYLIELKSGQQFVTDHYWEEGDQVKFYFLGGTAGFSKSLIKAIQESDLPYEPEEMPGEEKQAETSPQENPPIEETAPEKETPEIPPITEDQKTIFMGEKDNIHSGIEGVMTDFQKAKQRNDKNEMKIQREKLLKYHDELQALFEEAKKANGGKAPEWWPSVWHSPNNEKDGESPSQ